MVKKENRNMKVKKNPKINKIMPKLTPTQKTVCTKPNYVRFDDFEYYFFTKETLLT